MSVGSGGSSFSLREKEKLLGGIGRGGERANSLK